MGHDREAQGGRLAEGGMRTIGNDGLGVADEVGASTLEDGFDGGLGGQVSG